MRASTGPRDSAGGDTSGRHASCTCRRVATLTRRNHGHSRWRGPLVGVSALAFAGAAFALVIDRQENAWQRSFNDVRVELPSAPAPLAELASPPPAEAPLLPLAEAAPRAPSLPEQSTPDAAPVPPPIVLHVEPPADSAVLDARAAGTPLPAAVPAPGISASASPLPSASSSAAPPAASSAPLASASATPPAPPRYSMFAESVSCGRNTCNVGEICCNVSCGTCSRPGAPCDTTRRCSGEITYPESQSCGLQTCNVGLVCCNPSCGICAEPGQACSDRICG